MSKKFTAKQQARLSKRQVRKAAKKVSQTYGTNNSAMFYKSLTK